jgi:urea transport system ATP-binding protein
VTLAVQDLLVSYGRTPALFGVGLAVDTGGRCCLLGRNGVGKTTLMNAVMGVLPARGGKIVLDGRDITALSPWERVKAGLGYVPQERSGFAHLTVAENLQVVLDARKRAARSELDEVLDLFPALRALLKRAAGFLSGGQRQQLAIARAMLTKPRLLLLDEPTEGIQPSVVAEIEAAILALHARDGIGILLAEQYVELALRLADSYVVLEAGRVTASGETAALSPEDAARLLAL